MPLTYRDFPSDEDEQCSSDAAERKRAEEELREREAQYRSIFESTSDALLIFDYDGTIVEANPAACRMYGYPYEELIGLSGQDIVHPDYHHLFEDFKRQVRASGRFHAQSVDLRKDRSPINVEIHGTSFSYRGKPHLLAVVRDITERVRARQMLERRVEERTRELSTLLAVSQNVASTLELEPLLGLILDQLKAVVDYNGASILILEDEGLAILAYRGPIPQREALRLRFPLKRALVNREVIRRREPIIIPDVRGDTPLARAFQETAGEELEATFGYIHSWLGVPLMVKDQVIGMLSLDHGEPNHYSPQHAELAMAFANQVAVAIENARLFAQAERRMRELKALYRADEKLYRHLHLDLVLQALVDVAVDVLQADKSSLMVWDAQRERLVVRAAHGFSPETMAQMSFALGEGIVGRVAASGEPMVVEDTLADPRVARRITGPEEIHSLMHVPLKIGGQVFGVFNVSYAQPRAFGDDDRRLFLALAQRAALAIENAQLYEQARELAAVEERSRLARDLHDAVTQTLFSASLIAEVLPRLWERDPDEGWRRLEELRELTRGALAEMRTLLLELRPATLTEMGLADLLRQLAESITGRARVPVTVEIEGERDLPPEVKVALYRIAQEALNNVAKHAGASQATVSLRYFLPDVGGERGAAEGVELRVSDDGRGFDPESIPLESLGLGIMRERAEAIGASLTIKSEPGQGTQVVVARPAGY